MLFLVHMQVAIPANADLAHIEQLKTDEKRYTQQLQRAGKWPSLWRVVGQNANYSLFDVESNDELHTVLSALPLFPFLTIEVTPLAQHPAAVQNQTERSLAEI
ncbi:muconolactone Delta-isomerase [Burkholderia sp. L27(2015)]|uniref:muconolactone Delta-isomerase n=1 Tax=Burkholderia sp. L27(2015) TaxID=1641858 RepID=UPI00131AE139|nr:muconolactone Delta-isomerase family protein [Burkholderia sp. L27(2015)]